MLMLAFTFAVGLVLYGVAKLMNAGAMAGSEAVADFLYNFGITLWTSVVLAFLLEVLVDRQRQFTRRYLRLVEKAMRRRGETVPELDDETEDEQMKLMRELHTVIAALRAKLEER